MVIHYCGCLSLFFSDHPNCWPVLLPAARDGEPSDQLALMYAIADDNMEKVTQLISSGLDVNAVCHGRHAMCVAAQEGKTRMIDVLVDAGGDITVSDPSDSMWRRQPIHLAAAKGHVDVVDKLVSNLPISF